MTEASKLTRSERLLLATAVLRGVVAGATHAAITWLVRQLTI
ncbi:hypothetical protein [Nonomuraea aurantiaca]|nr:hypothetical protein [Nonomuraea aurantiaca]